jgi:LCP family protein required for cell wall assembly
MRTTLKKRTRGATNGFGTLPPGPPLDTESTPRSFYSMPRRNPLRLLGKALVWLVVLVLVAAGALAGGSWLFFNHSVAAIRPHSKEAIAAQKSLDAPTPGQPTTAIVIGYDKRAGEQSVLGSRSDTVMLLRADPRNESVTLMSFPRDLRVNIPGCKGHPAFIGRINEAYTYCGPRGTLETVKELTGIPINYMITVNFRAFTRIVDRLGGVYLDVDRRYFNDNSGLAPGSTYATINLRPGYQKLTGRQALDFVRYRHTDSDLYRVVRQQEFIKAFKQQISSTWTLFQLPGIVNTVTDNVEVAKGGEQALDPDEVLGYARLAFELPAGNFQQIQLENIYEEPGSFLLSISDEDLQDAVARFRNPDVDAPERALGAATGQRPPGPAAPPPSSVSVSVLNGNGVAGSASDAAYLLGQRGYVTSNGGNASNFDYFRTTIFYDPAEAEGKAAAESVGQLFGDADVREAPANLRLDTMLVAVVGKTFHGTLGPAPRDQTPEHEPPAVVSEPGFMGPELRRLQRRAGFRPYMPTVREKSSSLSDEAGLRLYDIDDHKAVRLTFVTSTGEYWGIQQTDWTDAPILGGPTLTRRIKGRSYRLYFDGPKLHMVAFEADGAMYWVVNTLLNRMSNETMLAIAQGLKPARAA